MAEFKVIRRLQGSNELAWFFTGYQEPMKVLRAVSRKPDYQETVCINENAFREAYREGILGVVLRNRTKSYFLPIARCIELLQHRDTIEGNDGSCYWIINFTEIDADFRIRENVTMLPDKEVASRRDRIREDLPF